MTSCTIRNPSQHRDSYLSHTYSNLLENRVVILISSIHLTWCSLTNDNKIPGVFQEFFWVKNFSRIQPQFLSRKKTKLYQVISATVALTEIESTFIKRMKNYPQNSRTQPLTLSQQNRNFCHSSTNWNWVYMKINFNTKRTTMSLMLL